MRTPSPTIILPPVLRTRRRRQRGQTAVVALLVLLLLSFVGALFITIVARNLVTQGRTHRTLNADYYAEAGLRYADDQLTASLDGADWRPALQNKLADGTPATNSTTDYVTQLIGPAGSVPFNRYMADVTALNLQIVNVNDPDKAYLEQGFTRYDTANGRFLLRVTYDPVGQSTADNPTARYIKIESIGREGTVNPTDPTTYGNQPATRLAATLVAYKPIAITDFARFETNIDNRSDVMNLGVPSLYHNQGTNDPTQTGIVTPGAFDFGGDKNGITSPLSLPQYYIQTTYGSLTAGPGGTPGGGSFFANASVRFYGVNFFYLASGNMADNVAVAGNILLNDYDPKASADNTTLDTSVTPSVGQDSQLVVYPQGQFPMTLAPSNGLDPTTMNPDFDTIGGIVRDGGAGSSASDVNGNPRNVARLDPPVIDTVNSTTHLTRYQALAENAPPRVDRLTMSTTGATPTTSGTAYTAPNAALFGYGRAIYINNTNDVQRDSTSLVGAHSLVDEWLNANPGGQSATTTKGGWVGPFYNPPGAEIVFGPQQVTVGTGATSQSGLKYGFRITRSDVDSNGNPIQWADLHTDPTGATPLGRTMTVTYDELYASNDLGKDPASMNGTDPSAYQSNPDNDVIIYAEGNVRVRGVISGVTASGGMEDDDSRPRHVTIVTNGTAYIDGNIIKGNPNSSITIMARDYVCVNTTQFLAGASDTYPAVSGGLLDFADESAQLVQEFSFGLTGTNTPTTSYGASPLALYISGGAGASGSVAADFDIANPLGPPTVQGQPPSINGGGNPFDTSLFTPTFDSTVGSGPSLVTHISIGLGILSSAIAEQSYQLWVRRDPGTDNPAASAPDQPFQLEHAAILPMDIRIEAVLYAQDKSFFVIPGPWFNRDTGDDLASYVSSNDSGTGLHSRPGLDPANASVDQRRFPFYGQPIDLKITIAGAVSEARPADIGAQAAWMQKWGWIPKNHGSGIVKAGGKITTAPEVAGHLPVFPYNQVGLPAAGLSFVYDPMDGYPAVSNTYLRTDLFGRPLPITPKLPVSTGLLYSGQNPGPSLLQ